MAESQGVVDHSPTPDSISEAVEGPRAAEEEEPQHVPVAVFGDDLAITSAVSEYTSTGDTMEIREIPPYESRPILPRVNNDLQLPSAFRPFVSEPHGVSPVRAISPTQSSQQPITSTPLTRRAERLTIPGTTVDLSTSQLSHSPNPGGFVREGSNNDDDDGRTTASAPPCTPAPESHVQAQSPFRNNRQIKRIDLLDMSRSRQSDRAENARRDGRLAPSPRKKDEVLRNSGFLLQPSMSRGFSTHANSSTSRLSNCGNFVSPERMLNGSSSTTSPNVDVVSIDDQNDESKYMLSIQFHDFERGEQMMKCNLCGFVTNNQKFYRRHRRLHSRPYHNNQIYCNQCDYSTTQMRRMREHSTTHQHLHHQPASTNHQHFCTSNNVMESSSHQQPHHQFQNHVFLPTNSNAFPSTTTRPLTLPVGDLAAAPSTNNISNSSFGLHPFLPPSAQDPPVQVNSEAGLQPPPRGSAMMGNYEGQVANYMRTVINNLMSPTRSHASNSVTSSTLYHSLPQESHTFPRSSNTNNNNVPQLENSFSFNQFWNHSGSGNNNNIASSGPGRNLHSNTYMKVKLEPRSAPISTPLTRVGRDVPSSTQLEHTNSSSPPRRLSDTFDDESALDLSGDDPPSSPIPEVVGSRAAEARISTDTNMTDSATQGEGGNISDASGSMPFVKMELPSQSETFIWPHPEGDRSHFDRGVQCNIISMSGISQSGRTQSETVSSAGGVVETKCYFCGITFDDEVLYTIHIGCHSHTDPFLCNVCGKQCRNKYGFYSHIMRGHQSRQNT